MSRSSCDFSILDDAGLNLQAVFDVATLPAPLAHDIRTRFPLDAAGSTARRLILIGHAGRRLWARVTAQAMDDAHPIDAFTVATVQRWLASTLPDRRYRIAYPGDPNDADAGDAPIGLQTLGQLAGWHHPSPFMVGVNARFGSWFAYRAVVLCDAELPVTPRAQDVSPCADCRTRPCIAACPAGALSGGRFDFAACSAYRLAAGSPCALGCLARWNCPVAVEHRYDEAQVQHSYARSLEAIRRYG